MPRSSTIFGLAAALGAAVLAGSAAGRTPEEIRADVRIGWDWTALPVSPNSAVRVQRALDSQGRPYDAAAALGCRPGDLRRGFHLPQTDYLLGEPITIELRVALEGPGTYQEPIGGNYRAHGRDDNFRFLVRAGDGTWVEDPYAPFPSFIGGGLGSTVAVKRGAPFSKWLAVQRWAALERPGVYDLYAVHFAHGYEVVGVRAALTAAIPARLRGEFSLGPDGNDLRDRHGRTGRWRMIPTLRAEPTPSPLARAMPPELLARLGRQAAVVQDYAHARVTVRAGTAAETATMVARAEQAAAQPTQRMAAGRADATREAIWFTRQTTFLPTLATWLRGGDRAYYAAGLAMNPSPEATRLLLSDGSQEATGALNYLPRANIPLAVPALIARLGAADDGVRSMSEDLLHRWTGQAFRRTWDGYRLGRPTVAEGRAMRVAYERWWRAHGAGFRPR